MERQLSFDEEENKYINELNFNKKSTEFDDPSEYTNVRQMENHILAESLKMDSTNIQKIENQSAKLSDIEQQKN